MNGVLKSPNPGRIESSPESDGCGATTMLRQMVRNGARAGGDDIARGGREAEIGIRQSRTHAKARPSALRLRLEKRLREKNQSLLSVCRSITGLELSVCRDMAKWPVASGIAGKGRAAAIAHDKLVAARCGNQFQRSCFAANQHGRPGVIEAGE